MYVYSCGFHVLKISCVYLCWCNALACIWYGQGHMCVTYAVYMHVYVCVYVYVCAFYVCGNMSMQIFNSNVVKYLLLLDVGVQLQGTSSAVDG